MRIQSRVPAPASVERFVCAISGGTIARDLCTALSKVPSKNTNGCTAKNCRSPWRLCAACIRQDGVPPAIVQVRGARLCAFHATHGEGARRPLIAPAPAEPVPSVQEAKFVSVNTSEPEPPARPQGEEQEAEAGPEAGSEQASMEELPVIEPDLPPEPFWEEPLETPEHESEPLAQPQEQEEATVEAFIPAVVESAAQAEAVVETGPDADTALMKEAEVYARGIPRIKGREKEVMLAFVESDLRTAARFLGTSTASVQARLNMACNELGIPRSLGYHPARRAEILKKAWGAHQKKKD